MNPTYLCFALPAILLVMFAQGRVQSAYNKYAQIPNKSGITGAEVARLLLNRERLPDVELQMSQGQLSDHYDPQNDILRLSPDIAQGRSIAALAVTAHEVGHALQDRDKYALMTVRTGLVPLLNIGSTVGYLLFAAGAVLGIQWLALIGIAAFSGGAIFSLLTLPVELDASSRAMRMLQESGLLSSEEERKQARDMLNAAALTYVAGAAQALSTVLYLLFSVVGLGGRRRG